MATRLRVLIVEDEALSAMLLQSYLEDVGHEVVGWATTAEEAVKLFKECAPDLAFVDLHLAERHAIQLRQRRQTRAEVIERQPNATQPQASEDVHHELRIAHGRGFRHFEHQMLRR